MGRTLTEKEQEKYLIDRIGDSVNFTYPEPPYDLKGTLKDRFVDKDGDDEYVTYWNVIDFIEFKGENENWLRITYYRYKKKAIPPKTRTGWVFAGQNALTNPMSQFEHLFTKAIEEKRWMRTLFKQVFKKCAKELE
jgi:hypothetical protein